MNKVYSNKFFCGIFILLISLLFNESHAHEYVYGNKIQNPQSDFTISKFTIKQGLPQNQIQFIKEFKDGRIILSTINGICTFDGKTFSMIKTNNQYRKFVFNELFFLKNNRISGTVYNGGFAHIYPKFKKINNNHFIIQEGDFLYGLALNGEVNWNNGKDDYFKKIFDSKITNPISFLKINQGFIISNKDKINIFNIKGEIIKAIQIKLVSKIIKTKKGDFLFANAQSIFKMDKQFSIKKITDFNEFTYVADILQLKSDLYYIASNRGLIKLEKNQLKIYNLENGFPTNNISTIFYHKKSDILMVGTRDNGLLFLHFNKFKPLSTPKEALNTSFLSIVRYKNTILSATNVNNIYSVNSKNKTAEEFITDPYYFSSLAVVNDTILAGTWGDGIILFKEKQKVGNVNLSTELPDLNVHGVFQDSKKRIWVATSNGLSIGKNLKNIKVFFRKNEKFISFYELKNKNICVGSSEGIYIFDSNARLIKTLGKKDGYYGTEVRSFYEDYEGKLWFGSYNGGLYCYHKNSLVSLNKKKNCQLPQDVFTLIKKGNHLFMSGNLGVFSIKEKDLNNFYYNRINYLIPYHYAEYSGMINSELNGGFFNNHLIEENTIIFPSIEGLLFFDNYTNNLEKTVLILKKLFVNDTLYLEKSREFSPQTVQVNFMFSSNQFDPGNLIYYQYKINKKGKNSDWSSLQLNSNISLKLLPPGEYELSVRAIDSNNDPNPLVLKEYFYIKPHYYQSIPFLIIVSFLLLFLIISIVVFQLRSIEKKKIEEEKWKTQIGKLQIDAIHARMDPHFMFNALNTIKYLLVSKKNIEAENLLNRFSLLLRKYLNYSDTNYVLVSEEIELLSLYVEIEKQRFSPSFEFDVLCDQNLNGIKIPSMLIQPFLENAIIHGISQIKYSGKISLSFKHNENDLIIILTDNGIGINITQKNVSKISAHISRGISLIKDKINYLKHNDGLNIEWAMKPFSPNGTVVELVFRNYLDPDLI
ncbi:MAG: histidine kinase [Flavobacteriia bacterium]|nr:histidine kinase [Flavobacteriia bacterium]